MFIQEVNFLIMLFIRQRYCIVILINLYILNNFLKEGEILGIMEFFSDNHLLLDAQSRNFSLLYQIKKSDFLRLIIENKRDYVKN